jgi:hypothetical protein
MPIENDAAYLRLEYSARTLRPPLFALAATLVAWNTAAQESPRAWTPENWTAVSKLPDWQGAWQIDIDAFLFGAPPAGPKLTAEYAARQRAFLDARLRGENIESQAANCLPPAMPGVMLQPYPIEFLFTPGKVTIIIEAYNQMRRIYTDGRSQPTPLDDVLRYGHSIGRWDGDTLVIESVGFEPDTMLAAGRSAGGVFHSEELKIVERISLTAPDVLRIETRIEDQKALAEPWTYAWDFQRYRDWEIREYICQQNNRDSVDELGRPSLDLGN